MHTRTLGFSVAVLLAACSSQSTRPASSASNEVADDGAPAPAATMSQAELEAMFSRELDRLPELAVVQGKGWSTKVPGTNSKVKADPTGRAEQISFSFEPSSTMDCVVHAEAIDPATYIGNIIEAMKKPIEVVRIIPKRFAVEQELPSYFISIVYRKQADAGMAAGELKLGIAVHDSRPIVCIHDAPGYPVTFEKAARAVFANYRVNDDSAPAARAVSSVSIDNIPMGFSQDTVRLLPEGQTEFRSTSTQIIPRSPTELAVSDEVSSVVASKSRIEKGVYAEGDSKGLQLQIELERTTGDKYKVKGTVAGKPIEATFETKGGLSHPDALAQQFKKGFKKKAFRFTRAEYEPSIDPTRPIEVTYAHEQEDPVGLVRVFLGQVEASLFVDENGEPTKVEIKAGSNTIVYERQFFRDDRTKPAGAAGKKP